MRRETYGLFCSKPMAPQKQINDGQMPQKVAQLFDIDRLRSKAFKIEGNPIDLGKTLLMVIWEKEPVTILINFWNRLTT